MEWQKCQEYRCKQVAEMRRTWCVKGTMKIPPYALNVTGSWKRASTNNLVGTQTALGAGNDGYSRFAEKIIEWLARGHIARGGGQGWNADTGLWSSSLCTLSHCVGWFPSVVNMGLYFPFFQPVDTVCLPLILTQRSKVYPTTVNTTFLEYLSFPSTTSFSTWENYDYRFQRKL